jgi:hypothetical protein
MRLFFAEAGFYEDIVTYAEKVVNFAEKVVNSSDILNGQG